MRELEKWSGGEKSESTFARVRVGCSHFKLTVALVCFLFVCNYKASSWPRSKGSVGREET